MTDAVPAQKAPCAAEVETPFAAPETGIAWSCGGNPTAGKPLCDGPRAAL